MSLEKISSPVVKSFVPLAHEEKETVTALAQAGTPIHKIADILQKNKRLVMMDFKKVGTDIRNAYDTGVEMATAQTNAVTLENAKKGNITAKQIMDKIWENQKIENLKQEIFNSE